MISPSARLLPHPAHPAAQPDPRRWLGLLALSISVLTVIMTSTSVNVALPAISTNFGITVSNLTWVIDAYTLAMGALTLPGGTLGDIFGRRRVYIGGLAIFSVGALISSAAPNIGVLTAGRVMMGIGAALVMPGTLSLISSMFEGRERATAIGLWGGMNGIALALGPVVGGVLVEYVDWRAVFWTNVPLVAIAFVMVSRYVPPVAARAGRQRLDLPGVLAITAALTCLVTALIQGPSWGWGAPATVACFAGAAILLACFIAIEALTPAPMLPLRVFTSRTFCAANLSAAVLMLGILSCFFFLSLFLQDVLGYSGVRTGLAYLPMAIFMAVLAPLAGRISARFGPRLPIVAGLLSSALGVFWLSRIGVHSGYDSLVGGLMLVGLGMGLASPAISNASVSSVPPILAGAASGMNSMSRQIGGAVGVALLTAIFSGRFKEHLTQGLAHSGLAPATQKHILAGADPTSSAAAANGIGTTAMVQLHNLIHAAFAQGMADTLTIFTLLSGAGVLIALLIRRSDFVHARAIAAVETPRSSGATGQLAGIATSSGGSR